MEIYNQISCGRQRADWNSGDTVLIESLKLSDKQKQAIRNGYKIVNGLWTFSPLKTVGERKHK